VPNGQCSELLAPGSEEVIMARRVLTMGHCDYRVRNIPAILGVPAIYVVFLPHLALAQI
jgi:hypothetical protein